MPDCTLQLIYLASCHLIIFSKKSIRALCLKPNCRTPVVTLKVSKNRHFLFLKYLSVPIKLVIFSYTKHYSIQYNTKLGILSRTLGHTVQCVHVFLLFQYFDLAFKLKMSSLADCRVFFRLFRRLFSVSVSVSVYQHMCW